MLETKRKQKVCHEDFIFRAMYVLCNYKRDSEIAIMTNDPDERWSLAFVGISECKRRARYQITAISLSDK